MKKTITLLTALIFIFVHLQAQQVYKGGGSSNSTFLLGYTSYCAKSQCIFLPSDLTNAASGNMTTLYYKYGDNGGLNQTLHNFTIKIGQTSATSFAVGNEFFTGLTTVMNSANYVIPAGASGGWFPISLDNTFPYDATQTLIIQLTFDSSAVNAWGTLGTGNNPVKKIISGDVNATTGSGSSATWQDMGFDLAPVGISTAPAASYTFDVFPNPVHDKMAIALKGIPGHDKIKLSLMNILGETVFEKNVLISDTKHLDVSGLPKGIYIVRAMMGDALVSKKVIIE